MPTVVDLVRRASGFMKLGRPKPVWFETVANRFPPLTFVAPKAAKADGPRPKNSQQPIWKPPKLVYPEDQYVKKLFKKWPMERLRPASINELVQDPKDAQTVINKQLELMETGVEADKAFEVATSDFKSERDKAEIRERLAQQQKLFMKDQAAVAAGGKSLTTSQRRMESIGEAIRSVLEAEKAILSKPQ